MSEEAMTQEARPRFRKDRSGEDARNFPELGSRSRLVEWMGEEWFFRRRVVKQAQMLVTLSTLDRPTAQSAITAYWDAVVEPFLRTFYFASKPVGDPERLSDSEYGRRSELIGFMRNVKKNCLARNARGLIRFGQHDVIRDWTKADAERAKKRRGKAKAA